MLCNTPRRRSAAKSAATKPNNVTAEAAVPGAMHLICSSESQMAAFGWPITARCRYACIRLHDWPSWGLYGRPSASLIYAPVVRVQGPIAGIRSLTKLLASSKTLHNMRYSSSPSSQTTKGGGRRGGEVIVSRSTWPAGRHALYLLNCGLQTFRAQAQGCLFLMGISWVPSRPTTVLVGGAARCVDIGTKFGVLARR